MTRSYPKTAAHHTLKRQMSMVLIIIGTIFTVAVGLALYGMRQIEDRIAQHMDQEQQARRLIAMLYAHGLQQGQALRNILLDPENPIAYSNYDRAAEDFQIVLKALAELGGRYERALAESERLSVLHDIQRRMHPPLIELARAKKFDAARKFLNERETPAWRVLRSDLLTLLAQYDDEIANGRLEVQSILNAWSFLALTTALAALVIGGFFGAWLVYRVLAVLGGEPREVQNIAYTIARGDLTYAFDMPPPDSLMFAMADMQKQLQQLIGSVRAHAQQLNAQLNANETRSIRQIDAVNEQTETLHELLQLTGQLTTGLEAISLNTRTIRGQAQQAEMRAEPCLQHVLELKTLSEDDTKNLKLGATMAMRAHTSAHEFSRTLELLLNLSSSLQTMAQENTPKDVATAWRKMREVAEQIGATYTPLYARAMAVAQYSEDLLKMLEERTHQVEQKQRHTQEIWQFTRGVADSFQQMFSQADDLVRFVHTQQAHCQNIQNLLETLSHMVLSIQRDVEALARESSHLGRLSQDMRESVEIFQLPLP